MAGLKEIRNRIKSVKSTQQITKAMKMVASAKLRNAEASALNYRVFRSKIEKIALTIADKTNPAEHFLLRANESTTEGLIVITSDRGLCGAFNALLLKSVMQYVSALNQKGGTVKIWVVGRKGSSFFLKQGYDVAHKFIGIYRSLDVKVAELIANEMISAYRKKEIGRIRVVFNLYKSLVSQVVTYKTIMPISENLEDYKQKLKEDASDTAKEESVIEYLYEPSETEILTKMLPTYLTTEIYSAILESYAGELASRMTAMDNASRNAEEMIGKLTLTYNRLRQAAITKEIAEIVGGVNALLD